MGQTPTAHIHELNISSGKEDKTQGVTSGSCRDMQQLQLLAKTIKPRMLSAAAATQQHRAGPPLPQPGASGFHSCRCGLTVGFLTGTLAPLCPYPGDVLRDRASLITCQNSVHWGAKLLGGSHGWEG